MELRLSEQLLLLAFNEKQGIIYTSKAGVFKYALAGAIIQELMTHEKLELEEKAVKLIDKGPTDDPVLDKAIDILAQSTKEKKIQHWISKLGGKAKTFKKILFNDLVNKGVLKQREDRDFRVPGGDRFKLWFDGPVKHLRDHLRDILVHGNKADQKSLRLIGLAQACKLTRKLFKDSKEQEIAGRRMEELTENDPFKEAIRKIVNSNRLNIVYTAVTAAAMVAKEAC